MYFYESYVAFLFSFAFRVRVLMLKAQAACGTEIHKSLRTEHWAAFKPRHASQLAFVLMHQTYASCKRFCFSQGPVCIKGTVHPFQPDVTLYFL